jgi:hypothetical protein
VARFPPVSCAAFPGKGRDVADTACVAGKFETLTDPMAFEPAGILPERLTVGVPEIVAVTLSVPLARVHVLPALHVPDCVAATVHDPLCVEAKVVLPIDPPA